MEETPLNVSQDQWQESNYLNLERSYSLFVSLSILSPPPIHSLVSRSPFFLPHMSSLHTCACSHTGKDTCSSKVPHKNPTSWCIADSVALLRSHLSLRWKSTFQQYRNELFRLGGVRWDQSLAGSRGLAGETQKQGHGRTFTWQMPSNTCIHKPIQTMQGPQRSNAAALLRANISLFTAHPPPLTHLSLRRIWGLLTEEF